MRLGTKEGTPAQASAAVGALAALAGRSKISSSSSPARSAASDALREACSARSLSAFNPRAASNVSALAAFARHFPQEFSRHEKKALAFAFARVAGDGGERSGGGVGGDDEDGGGSGTGTGRGVGCKKRGRLGAISPACQTLCASMELLCNCLLPPTLFQGWVGWREHEGTRGGRDEEILKAVFGLLEAGGQPAKEGTMSADERAELRLAGAKCLARLCILSGRVRVSKL